MVTPVFPPQRLLPPVTILPQPRPPASRRLAKRPLWVVHLAGTLWSITHSSATPRWARFSIVLVRMVRHSRRSALCSARRAKRKSSSDCSSPNCRNSNPRRKLVALPLLPYGPFQTLSGENVDTKRLPVSSAVRRDLPLPPSNHYHNHHHRFPNQHSSQLSRKSQAGGSFPLERAL